MNNTAYMAAASPYLLFTRYSSNIQRVYLDGTMYTTIYSGGYTSALDFDYRYRAIETLNNFISKCYFCCTGEGICFGRTRTVIEFTELGSMALELLF